MKNSKYKERAKKLVEDIMFVNHFSKEEERELLQAMCQLAEEVETASYIKFRESVDSLFTREQIEEAITICTDKDYEAWILTKTFREVLYDGVVNGDKFYPQKQVEELLQKQRELCAEKIEEAFITVKGDVNPLLLTCVCLNAKLKID